MHAFVRLLLRQKTPDKLPARHEEHHLLHAHDDDDDYEDSTLEDAGLPPFTPCHDARGTRARSAVGKVALLLLVVLSFAANVVLARQLQRVSTTPALQQSEFAHLSRTKRTPIYASTQYGPAIGTQAERNALWAALDISPGVIALPDAYADAHALPRSMRFPWAPDTGVYLLGAFHTLHCLQRVQAYAAAAHSRRRGGGESRHESEDEEETEGEEEEEAYHHVEHCLDVLLQDAMCSADDTPWYELPPAPQRARYARFQSRQCRSWDGLLDWAAGHQACFRYDGVVDGDGRPVVDQLEHYSFCPEGSRHYPAMREYFDRRPPARAGWNGSLSAAG